MSVSCFLRFFIIPKNIFYMTLQSLKNRKATSLLTLLSIVISTLLLLSLEKVRISARHSFENTVSKVDLIVGSRTSPLQILLYSVFRMGEPTHNIHYKTYETLKQNPLIHFIIPISLGDSHKGFRVVGTNESYFEFYKFRGNQNLSFSQGQPFSELFEVVIGATVAEKLNYKMGDSITLSHGAGEISFQEHAQTPFKIIGILNKTFTPVDQSVHISLEAIEAIHEGWGDGGPPVHAISAQTLLDKKFKITQLTSLLIGLEHRTAVFKVKREIDDFEDEPLTAVLPGVVLTDLWRNLSFVENILKFMSTIVFISSLLTLTLVLLSSLNERRREMAILRSLGAQPFSIFQLLFLESTLLTGAGIIAGVLLNNLILFLIHPFIEKTFGLSLEFQFLSSMELQLLLWMFVFSLFTGIIPARSAFKKSIADGLTVRT